MLMHHLTPGYSSIVVAEREIFPHGKLLHYMASLPPLLGLAEPTLRS
ncbi:hypothetical protein LINPERHAP2_LOCUS39562 [Linum perenne]